jgi:putative endopeptidase
MWVSLPIMKNTLLKTIPMANWKLYLKANAIEGYATDLSKPLLML